MRNTTRATMATASVATPISARRRRPFGPMFAARTAISVSALSRGPRDRSDRRWPRTERGGSLRGHEAVEGEPPPVHVDGGPGHVGGSVRGEEDGDLGDLPG